MLPVVQDQGILDVVMQFTEEEIRSSTAKSNARATELIAKAEAMFGSMSSSWEYAGVVFQDQSPHLVYWPETGCVQISLSFKAVQDELQRDFQLAHEVCHLLYPSIGRSGPNKPETNVLNEGISTFFSVVVVEESYGREAFEAVVENLAKNSPRYYYSLEQTVILIEAVPDAIKKIREIQPMIDKVTIADILGAGIQIPNQTMTALVERF